MTQFAQLIEAEAVLTDLAQFFLQNAAPGKQNRHAEAHPPNLEARYRVLLEQIPAVVFMAYCDEGIGEAYVSPQIEAALGFSQKEWLEDPVLWYQQIHPADKDRWSVEAAQMFLSGTPLRSSYRVMARDGRVVWFRCEARLVRREDGRPWFIHGVGFDITDLKQTEAALQEERNVVSAIFETAGALVLVLDEHGRIVRFNRACELTTGYPFDQVQGKRIWELFLAPEDCDGFKAIFECLRSGVIPSDYEISWLTRNGERRLIAWSSALLTGPNSAVTHIIATGIDITERKLLERTVLDISSREQRRIGQDLHDGLGQHLTGVAFLSKVLAERLAGVAPEEAAAAAKIVSLVNESIKKTRELARGLLPVITEARGLMAALEHWAAEASSLFHIVCRFECSEVVLIHSPEVADNLYHIAQEAVNNAIKHARAKSIEIWLTAVAGHGILTVHDNGSGFQPGEAQRPGLGLRIMSYRATMIGGSLEIKARASGGTSVVCQFPIGKRLAEVRTGDGI